MQAVLLGLASALGACAAAGRSTAEKITRDIERLRARDYAETGVCMLLTGEDLHAEVRSRNDQDGARLAGLLDNYMAEFLEACPDAGEDDVAALVELLADRDFAAGGGEFRS